MSGPSGLRLRLLSPPSERGSRVTHDDVLFGYRLQLFALAGGARGQRGVPVDGRASLDLLPLEGPGRAVGVGDARPRERRRPQMPNQLSGWSSSGSSRSALGHPGLGPRRVATRLARPEWGGLCVSPNGVYKTLCPAPARTRAPSAWRWSPATARPFAPPRDPEPEPHVESDRPGELVGIDCFFVGRLHGTRARSGRSPRSTPTQLRLGRPGRLPTGRPDRRAHLGARAPGRGRAPTGGLATRARAHR